MLPTKYTLDKFCNFLLLHSLGVFLHSSLGIDLDTKDWIMQPQFVSQHTYAMKNLTAFNGILVYLRHTEMSES